MNEVFTEEDVYCIENFGYNTTGEYDKIKQLESKDHLVIEELEYRLQQRDKELEEANMIKNSYFTENKILEKDNIKFKHIINELEKWVEYQAQHTIQQHNYYGVLDKIKELKGSAE